MLGVSLTTTTPRLLSLSPTFLLHPTKHLPSRNLHLACSLQTERGIDFHTGDTFFRQESLTGRDLGVLSAFLHKQSQPQPQLRVLDAMCGCGVRSLRYLTQSKADFVHANDANEETREVIVENLSKVGNFEESGRWVVSHCEANRLLSEFYLKREFFDLIDIDSFGSDSMFLRSAMLVVKLGGLLYLTNTDGYSSGGHRPYHSLAAYGAYVRPMPYANEVGLRMLIGGAVREASVLGYHVTPLFSYYSYHGPVFRVMLRLQRGKLPDNRHYGFVSYCHRCGNSQSCTWDELGSTYCPCSAPEDSRSLIVSGPLWTGPLHSTAHVTEMLKLAEQWEWTRNSAGTDPQKLLNRMIDESDPRLPPGYIKLDEVASRAKVNSPPIGSMMRAMSKEGYATSRSHIASNAIKTDCPMSVCIRIAWELQGVACLQPKEA